MTTAGVATTRWTASRPWSHLAATWMLWRRRWSEPRPTSGCARVWRPPGRRASRPHSTGTGRSIAWKLGSVRAFVGVEPDRQDLQLLLELAQAPGQTVALVAKRLRQGDHGL